MSKLQDTFTASSAQSSKKFRIDQDTQKILIVRTTPVADNAPLALGNGILSTLSERVSLEVQGLGSSRLSQGERIPLGKMAAFAQFGEGVIPEMSTDGGKTLKQFIPVILASVGVGLDAGDNSFILLENCVAGASYEVYAIQTPTVGNLVYEYLEQSVLAGDKHRKISVAGVDNIVMPVAGLQKLVVYYNGGGSCEYTPVELQFINAEGNDIETLSLVGSTTRVYGSMGSEAIVLKTRLIEKIEVYTDGNLYEYVTIAEIDRNAAR